MKKAFALLLLAAVVGIVISKTQQTGSASVDEPATGAGTASAGRLEAATLSGEHEGVLPDRRQSATPGQSPVASKLSPPEQAVTSRPGDALQAKPTSVPEPLSAQPEPAPTEPVPGAALADAMALIEQGDLVAARRALTPLYIEATGERARKLRLALDRISEKLVFDSRVMDGAILHEVAPGETLTRIGQHYGVSWRMIARLNRVDPKRIQVGQKLKVIPGPPSIVAWKSRFALALLMDGVYVKEYPIGVGKDGRTPAREFTVDNMLIRPRWYKPDGGIVEYGEEEHLLGERWIGFSDEPGAAGFGIHGTNDEAGIGTECSNGCLRMRNEDVMELYDFLVTGAHVEIRE